MAGETQAALGASCGEASPLLWVVQARPASVSQIVPVLTALPCDDHALQDSPGQSRSGARAGGSLPGWCPWPRAGLASAPLQGEVGGAGGRRTRVTGLGQGPTLPAQGLRCVVLGPALGRWRAERSEGPPRSGRWGCLGPRRCTVAQEQQRGRRGVLAGSPWSESALPRPWGRTLSPGPACETHF